MSVIKEITKEIKEIIKSAGYEIDSFILQPSGRPELGDFQINDAMTLAKKYGENPRAIAQKIVDKIEKNAKFTNVNIAGPGFINIALSDNLLIDFLNTIIVDSSINVDKEKEQKIVIDYGGANVAKALHVGHLRTANLGQALNNLAKALGHKTLGDTHLGDYGRPLGLVILEIRKRFPDSEYFNENYKGDYSKLELPITNDDLEEIYPFASARSKEDAEYLEEAKKITYLIQSKTPGYYDAWKKILEISKKDIKEIYDKLNVNFDLWYGESDAVEYLDELNSLVAKANVLEESNGAKIINVITENDNSPMPPLMYLTSQETITYATTDLATILQREKENNPDEIWYVVDKRQGLHFEQVFRATKKIGILNDSQKLIFVGNGTINGKDGKPLKTRDGGVVSLRQLISDVKEETYKRLEDDQTLSSEEKEKISETTAIAALKYADFIPFISTDYIFDINKFTDLEGKTGPYLLYSTIRMKSLLSKASTINFNKINNLKTIDEKQIALTLLQVPIILTRAKDVKSLHEIAEIIYKITAIYNKFYSENKILIEEDIKQQESWLVLTKVVYNTNLFLLSILGIKIPEKM